MFDFDKVKEAIEELDDSDKVSMWNQYCENNNYYDDYIEYNDPNELMCGLTPEEVIRNIDKEGNYSLSDRYCAVDNSGEYVSFDYADDKNSPFDIETLAKYVCDTEDTMGYLDEDEIIDKSHFTDFYVDLLADKLSAEDIKEICARNGWEYNTEDEDSMLEAFSDALYTILQEEDEEQLREHLVRVLCPTVDEETIEECADY